MRRGLLKEADIKPHLSRYWLTPAYEDGFDDKVNDINAVYQQASERAKQGQRTESVDEMTGVQALERKHPDLPILPGKFCGASSNTNGMALYLLPATSMLRWENWSPVPPAKPATKKTIWSILNAA